MKVGSDGIKKEACDKYFNSLKVANGNAATAVPAISASQ